MPRSEFSPMRYATLAGPPNETPLTSPASAPPSIMPTSASTMRGAGGSGGADTATSVCAEAVEATSSSAAASFVIREVNAARSERLHHHGHRFHVSYEPASKIAVIAHAPNSRNQRSVHGRLTRAHSSAPTLSPPAAPPSAHATEPMKVIASAPGGACSVSTPCSGK